MGQVLIQIVADDQGEVRQYMLRKELIATQDGVTIRYTGGQLD